MLESVIDSDMRDVEYIKLWYLLFMFETYFGLIFGARSCARPLHPLFRFQNANTGEPLSAHDTANTSLDDTLTCALFPIPL